MGKVLLTGATGFIGGELLRRLLRRDERALVCLVRAASPDDAARRGHETMTALFGRVPARLASRVEWVAADIERPRLGLDDAAWDALAAEVEEAYHCAASTRFDLPLDEAHRINVVGAQEVYALCEAARERRGDGFRRLHHVSTAYASGDTPGEVEADHLPDDGHAFRNSYERTKAAAERFLRARMDRVPITVYRPSIVVGDSRTGRTTSWNVVYFPMRLAAWGRLPFVSCGGRSLLDVVPVDYVCDAILALGARDDSAGQTFHLAAGEDALTVQDVIDHTFAGRSRREGREVPVGTRALGPLPWGLLTAALRLLGSEKTRRALDGFDVYVGYTRCDTSFAVARERALLAEAGVALPDPRQFFPTIVDYALAENFGKPRRPAPAPARQVAAFAPVAVPALA